MPYRELEGQAILVAEDEYLVARDLVSELQRHGALVVGPATSLSDAERLVNSTPLYGAILDIRLRDEMAFPVADQLAERGVPFVFATGYPRHAVPRPHHARSFYQKPYVPADVVRGLCRRDAMNGALGLPRSLTPARMDLWKLRFAAIESRLRDMAKEGRATVEMRGLVARTVGEPGNLALTVHHAFARNAILGALSMDTFHRLQPDLEPVRLARSAQLPHGDSVYFVEDGILSAFVDVPGGVDVGPIGREGLAGLELLGRPDGAKFRYVVQHPGDALRIAVPALRNAMARRGDLAECLLEYAATRAAEVAETAQAHVRLTVEQRLARHLLAYRARSGTREIRVTHDMLAAILGVRRASVTDAMHRLEGAGALRNVRGEIILKDVNALETICARPSS